MTREELQPKAPIQCTSGQCYDKDEVDKVMDAMEARIKELESKLYGNNGETTRLLNRINNFFTEDVKAKNIIEECYTCIHQLLSTISKMETTTPKWISAKDRLPNIGDIVLVYFDERVKSHYFPIDVVRWDSTYELQEISVTHWMLLPPPPTTKEKLK